MMMAGRFCTVRTFPSLATVALALWPAPAASREAPPSCRDRFLEPFSSDSVWNTAIGSGAVFKDARLFSRDDPRGAPGNFHNDQDFIIRVAADDPVTQWVNQGDWGADDKCSIQKHAHSGIPCNSETKMLDVRWKRKSS